MGDDRIDLPILSRVGLSVAVADGVDEVRESADYVTERRGGNGAVREVCDLILKVQGKWDEVTAEITSTQESPTLHSVPVVRSIQPLILYPKGDVEAVHTVDFLFDRRHQRVQSR